MTRDDGIGAMSYPMAAIALALEAERLGVDSVWAPTFTDRKIPVAVPSRRLGAS